MKIETTKRILRELMLVFGTPNQIKSQKDLDEFIQAYHNILSKDFNDQSIEVAADRAKRKCEFFPKISAFYSGNERQTPEKI